MKYVLPYFLLLFLLVVNPLAGYASTPPIPKNKNEAIGTLNEKLEAEKKRKEALAEKMKALQGDLDSTREELVRVGKSMRRNEDTLQTLESRITELEAKRKEVQETLQSDRASISRLILALQRLRRLPPEAIIARPGAPLETAQSAMLLQEVIPALNNHAKDLQKNLAELASISDELQNKREKVLATTEELQDEQQMLSGLLEKREKLYTSTHSDYKQREKAVKEISAQAKNLQDLVAKLEEDRKRAEAREAANRALQAQGTNAPPPVTDFPKTGEGQLPVSGIITIAYNQPDDFGAPSQGITITGRPGAVVVAPMGGIVRFAGPFKGHGKMVILEHKKGYHSLIAGLEKIDTVVGQSLKAGEPLGLMKEAQDKLRPRLYYELRHNGKPVNPSQKFAELG